MKTKLICLISGTCIVKCATIYCSSGSNVFMYFVDHIIHDMKQDSCKLNDFLTCMYTSDFNVYLYPRNHLRSNTSLGLHTLRSCLRVVFIGRGVAKVNEWVATFTRIIPSF